MSPVFLALFQKDLRIFFNDRRAVIMSFVAPIVIGAFFGYIFGGLGAQAPTAGLRVLPRRVSAIMPAAAASSSYWCSVLCAFAYAMLSSTSVWFRPSLPRTAGSPSGQPAAHSCVRGRRRPGAGGAPLRDLLQALRPEGALRVDVQRFALPSPLVHRKLRRSG